MFTLGILAIMIGMIATDSRIQLCLSPTHIFSTTPFRLFISNNISDDVEYGIFSYLFVYRQ